MEARSYNSRLAVEALEGRSMMSAVAYGDFNNDGRVDMAAITAPTTITVSLLNANGTYSVSETLTTPKGKAINDVQVRDNNGDGKLDVYAFTPTNGGWYAHSWLGKGDGTFEVRKTDRITWHFGHGGTW
jgi:hypothetical protein